jgi:hypothetical protein
MPFPDGILSRIYDVGRLLLSGNISYECRSGPRGDCAQRHRDSQLLPAFVRWRQWWIATVIECKPASRASAANSPTTDTGTSRATTADGASRNTRRTAGTSRATAPDGASSHARTTAGTWPRCATDERFVCRLDQTGKQSERFGRAIYATDVS